MLEAATETGLNRSISVVCEAADVSRPTFYRWLENDANFKAEWEEVWHGAVKRHLPGVVMAQVHKALDGDTRAAEFVAKMAGAWVEKKDLTSDGKPIKYLAGLTEDDL